MEKKKQRRTVYLAYVWLVVLAVIFIAATYAWFTFNPTTNVTPMSSTISEGGASLLIANNPNGEFAKECALVLDGTVSSLRPVSTVDLNRFYTAKGQNRQGISILFADATDSINSSAMHGKVYLKSEQSACDVYLYRSGLSLGGDAQTLAALRLGLRISTNSGTNTYIFRLDDMGNTAGASATRTVPQSGTVVSAVDNSGSASFTADPAVALSGYMAVEQGMEGEPAAGNTVLCILQADEVGTVEYWLYLEGCDDNCIGEVQSKDIGLALAFAGVER